MSHWFTRCNLNSPSIGSTRCSRKQGRAERGVERGDGIGDGGRRGEVHGLLVDENPNVAHFRFCTKVVEVGAFTGCAMRLR